MSMSYWSFFAVFALPLALGCASCRAETPAPEEAEWVRLREGMVEVLRRYGIRDERVLEAMRETPRHRYIPEPFRTPATAYADRPGPIGYGQTISQPYIVAYMTERLAVRPGEKILEIGTGSGYQAAILAALDAEVYTIEIVPELAEHARLALEAEGLGAVRVRAGDGYQGWPEHAPFDAVIVTCAPEDVPKALTDQLAEGGRMIIPVGSVHGAQRLVILRKQDGKLEQRDDLPVRFVPMVRGPEIEP